MGWKYHAGWREQAERYWCHHNINIELQSLKIASPGNALSVVLLFLHVELQSFKVASPGNASNGFLLFPRVELQSLKIASQAMH